MVGKQRPMMLSVALSGSFSQAPQAMQASAAPLSLQLPDPGRILAKNRWPTHRASIPIHHRRFRIP